MALSKGGNAYARALLRLPVKDATSGFRSYRRDCLAALVGAAGSTPRGTDSRSSSSTGPCRMGFRLGEVPITFREREHGHSKISRAIVVEALYDVARWAIRDRLPGHRSP